VNNRTVQMMANFYGLIPYTAFAMCFGTWSVSAQTCAPLPKPIATVPCNASELRPTQPSVGLAEIKDREGKLTGKSKKHQGEYLKTRHPVIVKGPNNGFYIVDHSGCRG
jgi:hypothetical protein